MPNVYQLAILALLLFSCFAVVYRLGWDTATFVRQPVDLRVCGEAR